MTRVELSVVIPFFNAAGTLPRCLEAILSQSFPRGSFEVIAVDNNSTDGSAGIVEQYPDVILLREKLQGAYAARNCGVASARGSILAFTDPDCIANANWLESIALAMQSPGTEILLGGYVLAAPAGAVRLLMLYENTKDAFVFGTGIPQLYYGHTNNMAVRRSTFDGFGPFVERRRGADTIFVRRVVEKLSCSVVRYDASVLVTHLELQDVRTYYRKMATYGESRESYRHLSWTRSLTMRERIIVMRRTILEHGLSAARSVQLAMLLSAGVLAWRFGRARAQLARLTRSSDESGSRLSRTESAPDRSKTTP